MYLKQHCSSLKLIIFCYLYIAVDLDKWLERLWTKGNVWQTVHGPNDVNKISCKHLKCDIRWCRLGRTECVEILALIPQNNPLNTFRFSVRLGTILNLHVREKQREMRKKDRNWCYWVITGLKMDLTGHNNPLFISVKIRKILFYSNLWVIVPWNCKYISLGGMSCKR